MALRALSGQGRMEFVSYKGLSGSYVVIRSKAERLPVGGGELFLQPK